MRDAGLHFTEVAGLLNALDVKAVFQTDVVIFGGAFVESLLAVAPADKAIRACADAAGIFVEANCRPVSAAFPNTVAHDCAVWQA